MEDFCRIAFSHVGLDWREHVVSDPAFFRPAEVNLLQGDASRAARDLGWSPKVDFEGLVKMMVEADLKKIEELKHRGVVG